MDKDQINPEISDSVQKELDCTNCGASLKYAPGTSMLTCEYCDTENEIDTGLPEIEEIDFDLMMESLESHAPTLEIHTVQCDSCGAESTLDENIVSDHCAFCGSPIAIVDGTSREVLKPAYLLPFKIEKKDSTELFQKWVKKLWFAPYGFRKRALSNDKINGMYVPYWTFDAQTFTKYMGMRGINYTRTVSSTVDGKRVTRTVVETRWFPVSGRVDEFFDDVVINATNSLPRKYVEKLEPWDLTNLDTFDERYLAGFRAQSYQVNLKDGFEFAKDEMEDEIRSLIRSQIGGDHQRIVSMKTSHSDITFKHILLPIWISAYRYKGKSYRFLINGRTGEVQGERPWGVMKIILTVLLLGAIIAGIVFFTQ